MCDNNEIGFYFSLIKKKMDKHMNEGLKKYDLTKSHRLEQKGFIERKLNQKDKRVRAIVLTQKEQDLHEDIVKQIRTMESRFGNVLGDEKKVQLLEILKELAENLE